MQTILSYLKDFFLENNGLVLITTIAVILCIEWLGRYLSVLVVRHSLGYDAAVFYDTRLTAIGVIFHELSHLVMTLLTGAKVGRVSLFRIFRKSDDPTLGYVEYYPRGPKPLQYIQRTLIGIAPAVFGGLTISGIGIFLLYEYQLVGRELFLTPAFWILFFLMSQIAYHSCPSESDIDNSWFPILLIAGYVATSPDSYIPLETGVKLVSIVGLAVLAACIPAFVLSLVVLIVRRFSKSTCS